MAIPPQRQRVAAYAVIVRDGSILLSRLSPLVTRERLWTLPGGGLDHGEDPRDAVVREVHEETGLAAEVSETARVYSAHMPQAWRGGRRVDAHAVRIVYEGWVAADSPAPRVLEVAGSTIEAAWVPLEDVASGAVAVTPLVTQALVDHTPWRRQRIAVYALVRRGDAVLLTRVSALGGRHAGSWTLPGGGVHHGESPAEALVREVREECGLAVTPGRLLTVHDVHFTGIAPTGRLEDFHGVHLVFSGEVPEGAEPHPEHEGTTDAAAFVPLADIETGSVPVLDVVRHSLEVST